ncbi:MAG: sulfite exporter TauE/SafE family protein [Epsilonproteobacteria bacterium]|nr:sulfite exporter TauE/SafE family protein [Campylobacterota bacterium]
MSISLIVIIGVILFLCSTIQGIVGFAFNIFAIPLLIWSGLGLSESISITAIPIFFQSATSTYKFRSHVLWKEVTVATIFRYMGIPIGIYFLTLISMYDKSSIKQIVGIAILFVVFSQVYLKIEPKEKVSSFWTFIAFFTSGLTLGLVSMGGPPAVLWVMAHKWKAITTRAFLSALFFFASPLQIVLLYYSFGDSLLNYFLIGLAFAPLVVVGTLWGVKLGEFLDREKLKKIIIFLLVITSLVSILSPYL